MWHRFDGHVFDDDAVFFARREFEVPFDMVFFHGLVHVLTVDALADGRTAAGKSRAFTVVSQTTRFATASLRVNEFVLLFFNLHDFLRKGLFVNFFGFCDHEVARFRVFGQVEAPGALAATSAKAQLFEAPAVQPQTFGVAAIAAVLPSVAPRFPDRLFNHRLRRDLV